MIMRDLTLSGRLPPLKQLAYVTSAIVYPIGGQIHRWLADTYGDWRVALMYKELNRHETFEAAIQAVYGRTLDQLSDEFQLAMRRQLLPVGGQPGAAHRPGHRRSPGWRSRPTALPDTGATTARGRSRTCRPRAATSPSTASRSTGGQARADRHRRAVGRSSSRSMPFESRMDASRPGLLLFTARYGDRDALIVWDLKRHRMARPLPVSPSSSRCSRRTGCRTGRASS